MINYLCTRTVRYFVLYMSFTKWFIVFLKFNYISKMLLNNNFLFLFRNWVTYSPIRLLLALGMRSYGSTLRAWAAATRFGKGIDCDFEPVLSVTLQG